MALKMFVLLETCYYKIHLNNSIFEMGNILYKKWVFLITQKVWVQGKGVYLPIVLYLYNSKIQVSEK
jgi:hypothetical protein